ncbi:hypothetical protein BJV78DRAFT_1156018 [Lactifluus subvellereus]|nr:hypothetical protein BJV78DRAFT_1156018 [Lactifluus subvellereus]
MTLTLGSLLPLLGLRTAVSASRIRMQIIRQLSTLRSVSSTMALARGSVSCMVEKAVIRVDKRGYEDRLEDERSATIQRRADAEAWNNSRRLLGFPFHASTSAFTIAINTSCPPSKYEQLQPLRRCRCWHLRTSSTCWCANQGIRHHDLGLNALNSVQSASAADEMASSLKEMKAWPPRPINVPATVGEKRKREVDKQTNEGV